MYISEAEMKYYDTKRKTKVIAMISNRFGTITRTIYDVLNNPDNKVILAKRLIIKTLIISGLDKAASDTTACSIHVCEILEIMHLKSVDNNKYFYLQIAVGKFWKQKWSI